jgi:hypothetical protein
VQNEQKLNEKLIYWRWPLVDDTKHSEIIFRGNHVTVYGNEGHCVYSGTQFTHSLDSCFKELVPKLVLEGYAIEINSYLVNTATIIKVSTNAAPDKIIPLGKIYETPALALCQAIEQLLDIRSNKC